MQRRVAERDGDLIGEGQHQVDVLLGEPVGLEAVVEVEGSQATRGRRHRYAQHRLQAQGVHGLVAGEALVGLRARRDHGLPARHHLLGDGAAELGVRALELLLIDVAGHGDGQHALARLRCRPQQEAPLRAGELDRGVHRALQDLVGPERGVEPAEDLHEQAQLVLPSRRPDDGHGRLRGARRSASRVLPEAVPQLGGQRRGLALPPLTCREAVLGRQQLRAERLPELARQERRLRLEVGELDRRRHSLRPLHQRQGLARAASSLEQPGAGELGAHRDVASVEPCHAVAEALDPLLGELEIPREQRKLGETDLDLDLVAGIAGARCVLPRPREQLARHPRSLLRQLELRPQREHGRLDRVDPHPARQRLASVEQRRCPRGRPDVNVEVSEVQARMRLRRRLSERDGEAQPALVRGAGVSPGPALMVRGGQVERRAGELITEAMTLGHAERLSVEPDRLLQPPRLEGDQRPRARRPHLMARWQPPLRHAGGRVEPGGGRLEATEATEGDAGGFVEARPQLRVGAPGEGRVGDPEGLLVTTLAAQGLRDEIGESSGFGGGGRLAEGAAELQYGPVRVADPEPTGAALDASRHALVAVEAGLEEALQPLQRRRGEPRHLLEPRGGKLDLEAAGVRRERPRRGEPRLGGHRVLVAVAEQQLGRPRELAGPSQVHRGVGGVLPTAARDRALTREPRRVPIRRPQLERPGHGPAEFGEQSTAVLRVGEAIPGRLAHDHPGPQRGVELLGADPELGERILAHGSAEDREDAYGLARRRREGAEDGPGSPRTRRGFRAVNEIRLVERARSEREQQGPELARVAATQPMEVAARRARAALANQRLDVVRPERPELHAPRRRAAERELRRARHDQEHRILRFERARERGQQRALEARDPLGIVHEEHAGRRPPHEQLAGAHGSVGLRGRERTADRRLEQGPNAARRVRVGLEHPGPGLGEPVDLTQEPALAHAGRAREEQDPGSRAPRRERLERLARNEELGVPPDESSQADRNRSSALLLGPSHVEQLAHVGGPPCRIGVHQALGEPRDRPGQRLREHRTKSPQGHADGVEVRPRVERRPAEELRGQVVRGAPRDAAGPRAQGPRAAEVDERAGAVLTNQHVLRLEVAVQQPGAV